MCTQSQDLAASAPTLRTAHQVVPAAPASMGVAATLSASLLITLASVLHHSGAATVNFTQPPLAPLLLPV